MEGNFLIKRKMTDGKYFTFGNVKKNQFGNYSLGLKVTPQLIALLQSAKEGEWVNLNLFLDDGKGKQSRAGDDRGLEF